MSKKTWPTGPKEMMDLYQSFTVEELHAAISGKGDLTERFEAQFQAWEAERAALEQANSKIAYYEGDGSVRAYEALIGTDAPRHKFTDEGICIRCGEDAEEWDAGCVEELRTALERARAALEEITNSLEADGGAPLSLAVAKAALLSVALLSAASGGAA